MDGKFLKLMSNARSEVTAEALGGPRGGRLYAQPLRFSRLQQLLVVSVLAAMVLHLGWQLAAYYIDPEQLFLQDLARRFGMDEELSVPTWLASALVLLFAAVAGLLARQQVARKSRAVWSLLAGLGLFISIDETAALHELVLQGLHIFADFGESQTFRQNAWLLVLPIIILAMMLLLWVIKRIVPRATFWRLGVGFGVYLAGALLVEYLSIPFDKSALGYKVGMVTLEESLELFGLVLIIRALELHIVDYEPRLASRLSRLTSA